MTRAIRRRDLLCLTAVAAATGIAGCDSKSRPAAASVSRSSSESTAAARPTSTVSRGGLSQSVLNRLAESDLPVDLSARRDLRSSSTSRTVVVGDIDPFYVKLAASYAQKTVDYFEPKLSAPPTNKVLVLLAKSKQECRTWAGGATGEYANYVFRRDAHSQGWVVVDCGSPVGQVSSIVKDPAMFEYCMRAAVFQEIIFGSVVNIDRVPEWVISGFTQWAQATEPMFADNLSTSYLDHLPPAVVPTKDSDFKNDPHDLAAGRAYLFVYYLAARYGEATALSYCQHMVEHPEVSADQEFPRVFGVSLAKAEQDWAASYKKEISTITGKTVE